MELQIDPNLSYALALEGGGAKGAWQIGAWRALREAGIRVSAAAGTSVGALNGALIAMGDLDKAEDIWRNIRYSQVMDVDDDVMRRLFQGELRGADLRDAAAQLVSVIRNRGLDVTPLQNLIRQVVDEEKIRAAATELYIVTYSLSDQKELELRARDLPEGALWDMLLASAYLPAFRNEKLGGKRYADGGVRDVLPLHVLIENGYRDIIALRLFGIGVERPVRIPRDTQVYTVEPAADLGGTLEFDPEQSRENLRAGYFDAMRMLYGLAGRKFYIDAQWDEDRSRAFLAEQFLCREDGTDLRTVHEKRLPALARQLDADKGNYTQILAALLERAAAAAGADPWRIYTEEELLSAAGGEAALAPLLEEASRSAPRQPGAAVGAPALTGRLRAPRPGRSGERGLNVCLMNDSFPPVVDGVANVVVNYARILTDTEGFCAVATPEYPDVKDDYPFPVVRYPSIDTTKATGYRAGNPFAPAAIGTLADMGFDLIHSHCPVASTIMARVLREQINAPIVFTYHTKFDIDIAEAIHVPAAQDVAVKLLVNNVSACDEVWVVSEGAGQNLRSLGYQGDYIVMPNGVDLSRGRAGDASVAALRDKWDLPADVPVYLFLGRMMWYKGLRLILDALARVKAAGRDFRMVFVGDGHDRAEVEAYAEELGLTDRCRFPGAERDREVIRAWYTLADLFLFPSTFDTNGLVVREAAACSLGSLLIEGSCAAEGITHAETGLLCPETAEGIAAVLLAPEAGREQFRRIGENAAERIYLSWEDSVALARKQYRSVLERWESGELRRKRAQFDGFFELAGDVTGALDRARDVFEKYF